jgi:hypothetical protein
VQGCNGATSQAWTVTADANTGGFVMKSAANPALCMEVTDASGADGARMRASGCGPGSNQKFKVRAGPGPGGSGSGGSGGSTATFTSGAYYRLVPQHTTAKSVDVCNGSQNNGTCVQQYNTITGGSGQKFTLKASGSNWAIAMGVNVNKCIAPTGTGNGAWVQVQDCNNSNSQAWTAGVMATGVYKFTNVASGRCLAVSGNSTAAGAGMMIYDCNGGGAQSFATPIFQ